MRFKNKLRIPRFLQPASGIFSNDSAPDTSASSPLDLNYPELSSVDVNAYPAPAMIEEKYEALEAECLDGKSRLDTSILQGTMVVLLVDVLHGHGISNIVRARHKTCTYFRGLFYYYLGNVITNPRLLAFEL